MENKDIIRPPNVATTTSATTAPKSISLLSKVTTVSKDVVGCGMDVGLAEAMIKFWFRRGVNEPYKQIIDDDNNNNSSKKKEGDVVARRHQGDAPIHEAVRELDSVKIFMLVHHPAFNDIDIRNKDGWTAFFLAGSTIHLTTRTNNNDNAVDDGDDHDQKQKEVILDLLLSLGADPYVTVGANKLNLLHFAVVSDTKFLLSYLLKKGFDTRKLCGKHYLPPLYHAIGNDMESSLELFWEFDARLVDDIDKFPLPAISTDDDEYISYIERRRYLLPERYPPLLYACRMQSSKCAKLIIQKTQEMGINLQHTALTFSKMDDDHKQRTMGPILCLSLVQLTHPSDMSSISGSGDGVAATDDSESQHLHLQLLDFFGRYLDIDSVTFQPGEFDFLRGHRSLLQYACAKTTDENVVKKLRCLGANIHRPFSEFGDYPIHVAIRHGNQDIVRYLLEEGRVDANALGTSGKTPLDLAMEYSICDEIVGLLLDHGANVDGIDNYIGTSEEWEEAQGTIRQRYPLVTAVEEHYSVELFCLLVEKGGGDNILKDPTSRTRRKLDAAANELRNKRGRGSAISRFEDGFYVFRLMEKAIMDGHHDKACNALTYFLSTYQPADNARSPLHCAIMFDKSNIVKLILDRGLADIRKPQATSLFQPFNGRFLSAFGLTHKETEEKLEVLNQSLLATTNVTIAKDLICHGADPNSVDDFGNTLLHLASQNHDVSLMSLLLRNGADPTRISINGQTALHVAGSGDCIRLLLSRSDVDINLQDKNGSALLHILAAKSEQDLVLFANIVSDLVDVYDANVSLRDYDGKTALEIAREKHGEDDSHRVIRTLSRTLSDTGSNKRRRLG